MQWCVARDLVHPTFVLRHNGPLVSEFEALGPVLFVSELMEWRLQQVARRLRAGRYALAAYRWAGEYRVGRLCRRRRIEVMYCNTATQGPFVDGLRRTGLPVVTHVHELERLMRVVAGPGGIETVIRQSEVLLAVSGAVRDMLIAHGARSDQIVHVPEPIRETTLLGRAQRASMRRAVFGVDENTIVVMACGTPSWRKGTDVFLQVAKEVVASLPDTATIAFRWIGGQLPDDALAILVGDVPRMGLAETVRFLPDFPDADRVMGAADVFVSTSREDPNPIVVLEAAAAGCPIVCFRGAGGAEELAQRGAGLAVPYLDARAMAAALSELAQDSDKRAALGGVGRSVVLGENTPELVAQRVARALRDHAA